MINKISLKFMFGFLGILVIAMVCLVITSYLNRNIDIDETVPEMNVADEEVVD